MLRDDWRGLKINPVAVLGLIPQRIAEQCSRIFIVMEGGISGDKAIAFVKDREGHFEHGDIVEFIEIAEPVDERLTRIVDHGGWTIAVTAPEGISDFEIDRIAMDVKVRPVMPANCINVKISLDS